MKPRQHLAQRAMSLAAGIALAASLAIGYGHSLALFAGLIG